MEPPSSSTPVWPDYANFRMRYNPAMACRLLKYLQNSCLASRHGETFTPLTSRYAGIRDTCASSPCSNYKLSFDCTNSPPSTPNIALLLPYGVVCAGTSWMSICLGLNEASLLFLLWHHHHDYDCSTLLDEPSPLTPLMTIPSVTWACSVWSLGGTSHCISLSHSRTASGSR